MASVPHPAQTSSPGVHPSAVVDPSASIDKSASVGPGCVVGAGVRIGAHTAIAALVGIAGSTRIGKHCVIAGKVGIADQLEICDGVTILAMTSVGSSIRKPGVYSGMLAFDEVTQFRRNAVRFRHLDEMAKDLNRMKRHLGTTGIGPSQPPPSAL